MTDTIIAVVVGTLAMLTWGLLALSDWLLGGGK
jgi:hypothetical protein